MVENWMDYKAMVGGIARRLARRPWVTAEELFVAGLWGLYEAAQTFDPARGVKFTTHARLRVTGEMKDFKKSTYGNRAKHALTGRIPADTAVWDRDLAAVDARDELEAALRAGVTVPRRAPLLHGGGTRGKRLTLGTECMKQEEWARRLGLTSQALSERIRRWGVERALSTPKLKSGRRPWKRTEASS